jgi:hypothetical protein
MWSMNLEDQRILDSGESDPVADDIAAMGASKPSTQTITVKVEWRPTDVVKKLDKKMAAAKAEFMERSLAALFKYGARMIFGSLKNNTAFRDRVEAAVRNPKTGLGVYWVIPLRIGGEASNRNMVVMQASEAEIRQDRIKVQLSAQRDIPKGKHTITIEKPPYPVFLADFRNIPFLAATNDKGVVKELSLPLDLHSAQTFKGLGFFALAKAVTPPSTPALMREATRPDEDEFADCGIAIKAPNRNKQQHTRRLRAAGNRLQSRDEKHKPRKDRPAEIVAKKAGEDLGRRHEKTMPESNNRVIDRKREKRNQRPETIARREAANALMRQRDAAQQAESARLATIAAAKAARRAIEDIRIREKKQNHFKMAGTRQKQGTALPRRPWYLSKPPAAGTRQAAALTS